jgi:acyl dehydratase
MSEQSLIDQAQGLKDILGQELAPEVFDVEKGHIRLFAQAIGDPNPLFTNLEYARKSRYGNIIAPPTFLMDRSMNTMAYIMMAKKPADTGFLNGGAEVEYIKPVKAGDTLTSTAKLVDLQEKTSKRGKMLFMIAEWTHRNQRGEVVTRWKNTFIAPQENRSTR